MGDELQQSPSRLRVALAWLLPFVACIVSNLVYMCLSWFPNHKYLEWAEARPQCGDHLPDLFLDLHDGGTEATGLTSVADGLPGLMLLATATLCAVFRNVLVWNRFLLTQGFVIALNCIAEQVTMLPSSYGITRCKAYLGIKSAAEDSFSFSPTGSCTAMIWSGHVFHMMIGGYMIGLVLEERFPVLKRRSCKAWKGSPLLKASLVVLFGLLEMTILVLDKGHYSVDMYLAILISMAIFTNDNVHFWIFYCNPFLKDLVPKEKHPMKHGQLKKRIVELEAELEMFRAKAAGQPGEADKGKSSAECAAPASSKDPELMKL